MNIDNMEILICKSDTFGGANYLLDRLYNWLLKNNYHVEQCIFNKGIIPPPKTYNLAILPSYIDDDIYALSRKGIKVERILLWIMGMGCFQDGYYNPAHITGIKGIITKIIAKEAEAALIDITEHRSICFTDVVGRYNTYKDLKFADEKYDSDYLIPIGISTQEYKNRVKEDEIFSACWVGRVSHDFKYIPLRHALLDFNEYCKAHSLNACFTVVGDGDAVDDIKRLTKEMVYESRFIPFVGYDDLDAFFATQDIAFVMGTSALDAARNSCPAVVVTPVREGIDEENVCYRWIFDSKGYSLGEYPGWDKKTNQDRRSLDVILAELDKDKFISRKCWEYTKQFDEERAFKKILECKPLLMDKKVWRHIKKFYRWRKFVKIYVKVKRVATRK